MPAALILSSHVAASRVGGTAQALALARLGVDPILVPTVQFGRHPGWGAPGGAATGDAAFRTMLEAIQANGVFERLDLVITGYFASAAQVQLAAAAIDEVRAGAPAALVVVDPIMGDEGKGLYVRQEVATAIAAELLPRADLMAPNAWELGRLADGPADTPEQAREAIAALGLPTLVSSIADQDRMGVMWSDGETALIASHPRLARAPNGLGDLLTALFAASQINGDPVETALSQAVGGVFAAAKAASEASLGELATDALGPASSPQVAVRRLS